MGTYMQIQPLVDEPGYELCKAQCLETVLIPVRGRVYRLLNDDFESPWKLDRMADDGYHGRNDRNYICAFIFYKVVAPPEGVRGYTCESTHISCTWDEWPAKMRAGEIVPDGEDIPPGKVRDWAMKHGIRYVFWPDPWRYQQFLESALKPATNYYERDEQLERSKELNAARASTRSAERVQRAIQRRAIANRVGPHVHRQLRPKVP